MKTMNKAVEGMDRIKLYMGYDENERIQKMKERAYQKGRLDKEYEMVMAYEVMTEKELEKLVETEREDICEKLQKWADETRKVNPDIAMGYDHAITLIRNDFQVTAGIDEWNGQEEM